MKALASDFDGTLFFGHEKDKFKKLDKEAIQRFQKLGFLFGLCTGRPLIGIKKALGQEISCDFYILTTGAVILDKNYQVIYKKVMKKQVMVDIFHDYHEKYDVFIQADYKVYFVSDHSTGEIEQTLIQSVDDIETEDIFGVSMNAKNEENARKLCADIQKKYGQDVDVYQNLEYLDIVAKGCSKGKAIQMLAEMKQIPFMCSIGDSYNDIPMLESADLSFTFHRSPEIVKQKANKVVDSIAEAIDLIIND